MSQSIHPEAEQDVADAVAFYSHPDDQIRILVVQHQRRNPGYGGARQ